MVTGASGFIGRALIRELARREVNVIAVSRRPSSAPANVLTKIVDLYEATPPDPTAVMVHLAELADIREVERRGSGYLTETTNRTKALLENNYARFVYVSSGKVYRNDSTEPKSPTDLISPNGIYASTKLAAEDLVRQKDGVIVRLGNIYGPPVKQGTVIADILDQIENDGPIMIRDDNPARDYLWIDDAAKGLAGIALGLSTGIFNLGSGVATSPSELACIALDVSGEPNRSIIANNPKRQGEIDSIALDFSDTTAQFGWRPRWTLAEGINTLLKESQ